MTPITRKENYLNEIVGWGETAPEKPLTPEEFFFAAILGEAVQAPEPLTRYQMYLAKIAGRNIEIPTPITRLEHFLAKAAGVEIETPTPITREEIFWSNYSAIVDFEVEGVPPLTYKAIEGTLENYRIYGDTVDGESVGDRTGNLFDKSGSQYGNNLHWAPNYSLIYSDAYYGSPIMDVTGLNTITRSYTGTGANYFSKSDLSQFVNVSNIGTVGAGVTVNVPDGYTKYVFNIPNTIRPDSIMVNSGSTVLPYEPYGYKVPVTVEGKNLLPNTAISQTVNGVTFTVNEDGSVTCNGTATALTSFKVNAILTLPVGEFILTGCPTGGSWNSSYYLYMQTDNISPQKYYYDIGNGTTINNTSADIVYSTRIVIESGRSINNLTFYPMIRKAGIVDDTYEPYHAPVTTPIYLPEQIKMVGDEAEYIDYAEQKMHRIGADDLNVALPALPTLLGTNTLTVGTEVQPSNVYIKYKGAR